MITAKEAARQMLDQATPKELDQMARAETMSELLEIASFKLFNEWSHIAARDLAMAIEEIVCE